MLLKFRVFVVMFRSDGFAIMSEYIEHDQQGISVGIVEKKFFTFAEPPDEMVLENGARLGPVTLAFETYGELNADKSNAVLILHALSGDSHAAGYYTEDDEKPGWWDNMVGPGERGFHLGHARLLRRSDPNEQRNEHQGAALDVQGVFGQIAQAFSQRPTGTGGQARGRMKMDVRQGRARQHQKHQADQPPGKQPAAPLPGPVSAPAQSHPYT